MQAGQGQGSQARTDAQRSATEAALQAELTAAKAAQISQAIAAAQGQQPVVVWTRPSVISMGIFFWEVGMDAPRERHIETI